MPDLSGSDAAQMSPQEAIKGAQGEVLKENGSPMMGHNITTSKQSPDDFPEMRMCGQDSFSTDADDTTPRSGTQSLACSPTQASPGKLKANVPPAIAEETPEAAPGELPSRGSGLHEQGDCSPCVWFWKPQGCQRGGECGYCHLCPEGEIKNRRKAKLANIRGSDGEAPEGGEAAAEAADAAAPAQEVAPAPVGRPTPGSANHGSGECRPCMWFYKPQGCGNADDCLHCHLCPDGEIKSRKKSKAEGLKVRRSLTEPVLPTQGLGLETPTGGNSPHKVGLIVAMGAPPGLTEPTPTPEPAEGLLPGASSAGSAQHGTGECRPCAWFHKAQGCENGAACRHCHLCPEGEIKARRKAKVAQPDSDNDEAADPARTDLMLPFPSAQQRRTGLSPTLPSVGSALHGSDMCRPCAWFHKEGGCENGLDCRHCHLCSEGEIQKRRKSKVTQLKKEVAKTQDMSMEHAMWVVQKQQEALIVMSIHAQVVNAAMWEAVAAAEGSPMFASPLSAMNFSAGSPFGAFGMMSMPPSPVKDTTARAVAAAARAMSFGLPSAGSALHSSGTCKPCDWFWKPQGCQNGQACAHCHLCPEGAAKEQKRQKHAATQKNAMTKTQSNRSPRMIKLSTVI